MSGFDGQFNRFLTPTEKDQLFEIIKDGISDLVWNKFFYISVAEPTVSALTSGQSYSDEETNNQTTLSILKPSKFRCVFNLLAYNPGGTAYITTNHIRPVNVSYNIGENDGAWSGFKIDTNGLSAMNFNKGFSTEIVIDSDLTTGDDMVLEIQFFPRERADFYLNGEKRASIADNLPSDESLEIYSWHFSEVLSGGSTLDIQRVEFLQDRD